MKPLATITGENGEIITISLHGTQLFTESPGEPTIQVGGEFATEQAASEYILASWGRNWNLTWIAEVVA